MPTGSIIPPWIFSALSTEQQSPFLRVTQNASILASAGSGKTRTLVNLVAADLAAGVSPSKIVAFTFTEKAADELAARLHLLTATHLPQLNLSGMFVGTIHSWCLKFLVEKAGLINYSPLDELHLDALVSRLYDHLSLADAYKAPFPKGIKPFLADLEVLYNEHVSLDDVPLRVRPSVTQFVELLHSNRLLTFGTMIRRATEILTAAEISAALDVIYVDEYQDVNPAQVALIKAMARDVARVIAVGDDLQCIYQWRGSDVTRILDFGPTFGDTSIHRLKENHRSRPTIVSVANRVADAIHVKDPLKVMLPARAESEYNAFWISVDGEDAQAELVRKVVQRFATSGIPYSRIAILLRSVTGSGPAIYQELRKHDIPVQCPILSRGHDFLTGFLMPLFDWLRRERAEPKNEQEAAEVEQAATTIWQAANSWSAREIGFEEFWLNVDRWQKLLEANHNSAYNVRDCLYDLLDSCAIRLKDDSTDLAVGLGLASQIIRSVEEVHRRRIAGNNRRRARGILSEIYFALIRRKDDFGESVPINPNTEAVVLSTVHQAKGLEWPIVILPMMAKRRFPVSPRPHGTSFPDAVAARYGTTTEDERRLFYVAVTRARERLILIDPCDAKPNRRSEFLSNIGIKPSTGTSGPSGAFAVDAEDLKDPDPAPLHVGLSDCA